MVFERTLPCGLRLVGEPNPQSHSVCLGLWGKAGAVMETPEENGLSHFIEHMLFKGTDRRSAQDIAIEMDSVGGNLNAYTTKECTCYYAKVVDDDLPLAADILLDMVFHSRMAPSDLELERTVVLEEIAMIEDVPEDYCQDLLAEAHFSGHPLSQQIIGTEDNLRRFAREDLQGFMDRYYRPGDMVLSVVGNFDFEDLARLVEARLPQDHGGHAHHVVPAFTQQPPQILIQEKDIEQVHLTLGFPGVSQLSPDLYPLLVLNNMLGGGMSSRLFQRIREERGLAYSVYAYPATYVDCGMYGLYVGTNNANLEQVVDLIRAECRALRAGDFSDEELQRAISQLKGNYILGLESSSSRMSALGRGRLLYGRILEVQDVLDAIKAVRREDVLRVAQQVLTSRNMSAALVGPVERPEAIRARIQGK